MRELIERLTRRGGGISEEVLYAEHCAEFRALNSLFWQIPVLVTTLSGGLWFALVSLDLTDAGQRMILWFSAIVNIAFLVALFRLRAIMERLLDQIRAFEGRKRGKGSYMVLSAFAVLMVLATLGAIAVSLEPSRFVERKNANGPVIYCVGAQASEMSCRILKP